MSAVLYDEPPRLNRMRRGLTPVPDDGEIARDLYPVPTDVHGYRSISPTDVSRFIGLEQCERYLRLRLHERAAGSGFLDEYGVTAQTLPPLLTRSGADFESAVATAIGLRWPSVNLAEAAPSRQRPADNATVVAMAAALQPGETRVLSQPRGEADVDGWRRRGD